MTMKNVLRAVFAAVVMFTPSFSMSTPATSSTSSVSPVSSQPVSIFEAAMYTCGNNLLNANPMLFPPADTSLPNIVNDTLAAIVHNDSYTTFCGQLPAYLLCVKEAYRNSPKDIDNKLKIYIDVDGLDSAMDLYCHNNDSITSQFQCTKQAVESYSCPYGGIYGMMKYVAMAIHTGLPRQQFCTGVQEAIRCRVDNQLEKCDTGYAFTMENVYYELIDKICP